MRKPTNNEPSGAREIREVMLKVEDLFLYDQVIDDDPDPPPPRGGSSQLPFTLWSPNRAA
jgi:hypothetical protein